MKPILLNESDLIFNFFSLIRLGKPGVLIDVGAHVGGSLLPFAKDSWEVYAYEPERNNFAELKKNLEGFNKVHLYSKAVAEVDGGKIDFYVSNKHWGIHSIKPFHPTHINKYKVPTVTLKKELKRLNIKKVDFLKIDTEGADYIVLKSMDLNTTRPVIVMCEFMDSRSRTNFNYTHENMVDYMDKFGYKCFMSKWSKIVGGYGEKGVSKNNTHFISLDRFGRGPKAYWGNLIFMSHPMAWIFNYYAKRYINKLKVIE